MYGMLQLRTDEEEEVAGSAAAAPVGLQHAGMIQVAAEEEPQPQNEEDYTRPPNTPPPPEGDHKCFLVHFYATLVAKYIYLLL